MEGSTTMDRALRKNYVTFFFISLATMLSIVAGNDEELFLRGNNYYEQKEYDNAFRSYDLIGKKGCAVLYNMGNCLFHTGDYSHALVYWSRAEQGATPEMYYRIVQNKQLALKKIGAPVTPTIKNRIYGVVRATLPYVSLLFLQLFFLLCWYLFICLSGGQRTGTKKIAASFLCLCMAVASVGLIGHYTQQDISSGIITKKNAVLFAGPDKGFHELSLLAYADSVVVKEAREGWYKIRYADMLGWVEADVVQII
jgi:hypothetical protein